MGEKISIVIPVYNSAHYLEKCLNSIVTQTYSNLQIICVDDSSIDDSWEILMHYASRDGRFKIFRKKNEGVSEARNYGIKQADGEYLMFVDSDDWIEEKTCELVIDTIQKTKSDIVMWSYVRELLGESRPKNIMEHDRIYEGKEVQEQLYRRMYGILGEELVSPENADALCTVWGKLYRRNIIEKNQVSFFDIRKIGNYEDGLFNLDVFRYAKRVVFLNQTLYHYRRDNVSSITSEYNAEIKNKKNILFDYLEQCIQKDNLGLEYVQALNNRIVLSLIELGINEMSHQCSWINKVKGINEIITTNRYRTAIETFDYIYLPIYWKLFFKMADIKCSVGIYGLLWVIQKIRRR